MPEPVMVGIASIPGRERALEQTLAALAPQVDQIFLSLNGHAVAPRFVRQAPNVTATLREPNGGDAEKFAAVDNWDGWVVTCDDDVLYPPDYVSTLIAGIERHGRRHMAGFHGGRTLGFNGRAQAATHKQIRCLGELAADDLDVNVLGTGALGFHTAHVPVWRDVFRTPNMADVYMATHARTLGIPMVALAHEAGWMQALPTPDGGIYEANRRHDLSVRDTTAQRRAEMARHDWTTRAPARPRVRVSIATCKRPDELLALLGDLERETGWADLEVAVYEDPTEHDYSAARRLCRTRGWAWRRMRARVGREEFWKLVDQQFRDAKASTADWFLFLPDDVRLLRHAIPRAIDTWGRLDEPAALTLWRLRALEGKANWTGKEPVQREGATEIFHVDGLYLCRRPTLAALDFRCPEARPTRRRGSGVGRVLSTALDAAGKRMYRVDRSLVANNDGGISIMNPAERLRRPAVTL